MQTAATHISRTSGRQNVALDEQLESVPLGSFAEDHKFCVIDPKGSMFPSLQIAAVSMGCVTTIQAVEVCVGEDHVWRAILETTVIRGPHRATLTGYMRTVTSMHTVFMQS